ncbi:glycosyltransferase [Antrihabitans stalactiti]|uniref:Glycosyltransferase n=1 Tax=Antrihabitans stalactiti TaxID=2584121 RepID=A0A848KFQ9_9NOCA|nr:glycosyltransferase [Antrihabitans stalactiti]
MSTLSIITPAYRPSEEHLLAAYESIREQVLPVGWSWEWIVQEDGDTGVLESLLPADPRISIGSGRRGGAGVARTLALGRASGELTKALDADDLLAPGALARDIEALDASPDIGWSTCRALDLLPDGTTVDFDGAPADGRVPSGTLFEYWHQNSYRLQVVPGTLCIRTDLALALGGWMALPASEDTGLLLAADAVCDGWFSTEVGLLYRQWPGQSTAQAAHTDDDDKLARSRVIERRVQALAAMRSFSYSQGGS